MRCRTIQLSLTVAVALAWAVAPSTAVDQRPRLDHAKQLSLVDFAGWWAKGTIRFYQRHITQVDGSQCPMVPSCSNYGYAAVNDLGWWRGTLATVDRLNRCKHDLRYYPLVERAGRRGYLDSPPRTMPECPAQPDLDSR